MIYHYCRVSSKEQNLDRQLQALAAYKAADRVFADKQSGKSFDRVEYQMMKSVVKCGDEVVVKELDRLGRNKDAVKAELEWFKKQGVVVRVLDIPTTMIDFQGQDWLGEMVNNILIEVLGAIAEQERMKIRKRQREGLDAMEVVDGKRISKKTGRACGRPRFDDSRFGELYDLVKQGELKVADACTELGICRATWFSRAKEMMV